MLNNLELAELASQDPPLQPLYEPENAGVQVLSPILYEQDYKDGMALYRALIEREEYSHRGIAVTKFILAHNPAHYSIWAYRAKCLAALSIDPLEELSYVNRLTEQNGKNYQLWHHRELQVRRLGRIPEDELETLETFLVEDDAKNYHLWSYLQWLIGEYGDKKRWREFLPLTERLIERDPYNNSAWNHRHYVLFDIAEAGTLDQTFVGEEIRYAITQIDRAPDNVSSWWYARAVAEDVGAQPESSNLLKETALRHQTLPSLDYLAEHYEAEGNLEKAKGYLTLLSTRDKIRVKYWQFRISRLGADDRSGEAAHYKT
ncbi:CAAX geranylgeranyltransferase alpha subunit [Savitreella phatthalungensis]